MVCRLTPKPVENCGLCPQGLLMLETHLRKVAVEIVRKANKERPADGVLRETLKASDLSRYEGRSVSHAVFSYFRWFGWISGLSIDAALAQALDLDKNFSLNPETFSEADLKGKAVPAWALECVDVSLDWLRALQSEPELWLRTKRGNADRLARRLGHCDRSNEQMPETLRYDGREDLFRTPEFHAGEFELQDIASQAVGLVCAPEPGETWWDACAGEGGKTLHLSDLMQNKGLIWASDRAEWRLRRLKQRTGRAGVFNYRAAVWTGDKLPTKTKFDGVLLDAPCSGVGTWQRNPHARWTTQKQDVLELAEVQSNLLARVAESVKPGGKLIYSVCTLTRNETIDVAAHFEKAFPEFEPMNLVNPLASRESRAQLWLWPQHCHGNGMFICGWRRKK